LVERNILLENVGDLNVGNRGFPVRVLFVASDAR